MKKFAAVVAVAVLVAFAAPVFAATNPFMDVPMNHWAYDAIGQLAAHGILSGYPDGTYKGKQPTTRYEMASALARALAVVDMTKASKQDVEMLKKLVVEFKDELEALGVTVLAGARASKVVAAVRGMANIGPMQRRMAKLKSLAKDRLTFPANLSTSPPALNVASRPRRGMPMPVIGTPKRAAGQSLPPMIPI